MAHAERTTGGRWVLVADSGEEQALLAHGKRQGRLVLEAAYYPVQDKWVILPDSASGATAERLAAALTRAAARHQEAVARRSKLRLL